MAALLLPWNIHFGVGVPDSAAWLFAVIGIVTLLGWVSAWGTVSGTGSAELRSALILPYLLVVAGFVGFAIVEAVRFGGTGEVPAGVGPGAVIGLGGALLCVPPGPWLRAVKAIGIAAMALATVSVLFNLYWRTRFVLPHVGNADFGGGNLAVLATTFAYGLVALVVVLAGLRWLVDHRPEARLAVSALGVATVLGLLIVWSFSIGRDIDAFHGIAQTTSTAAVGFEGYVAWVAAAALVAPVTLRQLSTAAEDKGVWRDAIRNCLLLMAIWFIGCAALRVCDVIATASLGLPLTPYDSIGLLAFDIVAAAVAIWVRFNLGNSALHPVVVSALCGVLFVLSVCRVAVGVGLAPRILYSGAGDNSSAVYGNSLTHQITSTFDVVMCGLSLAVAVIALLVLQRERTPRPQLIARRAATTTTSAQPSPPIEQVWGRDAEGQEPTQVLTSAPRIARAADPSTQQFSTPPTETLLEQRNDPPKIARLLEESTQRFSAGTTYTGKGRRQDGPTDGTP
ncbi:hypothetical protein JN086_07290 [Mycolicibacterium austroafricanum]|uniref:DUF7937 domain-containing protein n=1 Tax=Mycolicibacterium austroafricanum TaxID=39687 RepID=UPI001ABEE92B|nr:hypothetical protein [Mycolicibacterium austroafricanum]QRZ08143.1 hypothetical protein JN090_06290 [Mycolicibacterium austroafricanum]QZT69807.1 hypothetical protein JN086_07290 [Mycolicibacterium austroafricanum]